jgi:hypothetical protein
MPTSIKPIEGNWYEEVEMSRIFQVISVDFEEGMIEIEDDEGEVEELTLDDWYDMDIEPSEKGEDWSDEEGFGYMDEDEF